MKTEFELIIDKLNLDERNISYTAEDEYLHINSILDFSELESIIDEFDLLVETNNELHVITHNWCSI